MDMKKFTEALEALMREHGMELSATPEITLNRPRQEAFISHDMGVDAFRATRERQPVDLRITARASVAGAWHHESGDDRRLHPDLRSNAKSQATDAALSRQVACTDGLGAAVQPAPTFEQGDTK